MVIRDRNRAGRFVSMAVAYRRGCVARAAGAGVKLAEVVGGPCRSVVLPFVGAADVWAIDGRAIVRPRCGRAVLVVDWFVFCRFLRRRSVS